MNDGYVALIQVIVFIESAILLARTWSAPIDNVERGPPAELRGDEVTHAEKAFRSHTRRLVARLGRAYRTPVGIQLVELKMRPRDAV